MIPCGSCCIVAATAISGWPSAMASRIWSDDPIAKLRRAGGNLLLRAQVRPQRHDRDVETFVLVIALHQRGEKSAVFRLRIPIRLQRHLGQTRFASRTRAGSPRAHRRDREQCNRKTPARRKIVAHVRFAGEYFTAFSSLARVAGPTHGFRDSLHQLFRWVRVPATVLAYAHGEAQSNRATECGLQLDEERMREVYEFTARTLKTAQPVPSAR